MPDQNDSSQTPSQFVITTSSKSKKGGKKGIIIASLVGVFLVLSIIAGVLLVRQNQNIQEKASQPSGCPESQTCNASNGTLLVDCSNHAIWPNSTNSLCNTAGRKESCGGTPYCCPTAGGKWTTNMSACPVATATPTATPVITTTPTPTSSPIPTVTPSPTASPTPTTTPAANPAAIITVGTSTPTATATSVSSVQATPRPVPVTGTEWPTLIGAGVGIMVIIGAIFLAI